MAVASAGRLNAAAERLSMDFMAERLVKLMAQPQIFALLLRHDLVARPREIDADTLREFLTGASFFAFCVVVAFFGAA